MPEFLSSIFPHSPAISPIQVFLRLTLAALLGFAISWVYRATRDKANIAPAFPTTLILLSVLIAMVTEVVGDNVARAFSLVGALSIVRFRTVLRDTHDTAFVMFAVIVGMAVGANNLWVALIGLVVVTLTVVITMWKRRTPTASMEVNPDFVMSVLVGLGTDVQTLKPSFERYIGVSQLRSFRTVKQGAALEAIYAVRMRDGASPMDLVRALNHVDGVQSVEVQRPEVFEE